MELRFEIIPYKPGIPSKCMSLTRTEYVPALCTHRPSLLPIERFSEVFGLGLWRFRPPMLLGKTPKLERLEEVKVVTRFP